ncbi:MAG: hypothetical protein IJ756_02885 [Paludibacteraceae bacterium]|nr:hypothetical protein [Paludibacteraceae bacterium]MBR1786092.1 hypothetical protein [Paludibacteraceae bacterium]
MLGFAWIGLCNNGGFGRLFLCLICALLGTDLASACTGLYRSSERLSAGVVMVGDSVSSNYGNNTHTSDKQRDTTTNRKTLFKRHLSRV